MFHQRPYDYVDIGNIQERLSFHAIKFKTSKSLNNWRYLLKYAIKQNVLNCSFVELCSIYSTHKKSLSKEPVPELPSFIGDSFWQLSCNIFTLFSKYPAFTSKFCFLPFFLRPSTAQIRLCTFVFWPFGKWSKRKDGEGNGPFSFEHIWAK